MGDNIPFLSVQRIAASQSARRQRAGDLGRSLLTQISTKQGKLWTTLLGASVLCAALVMHQGPEAEIFMGAIALASLLSSVAGFAFSAICGAMLFHLSNDPVRVVQVMMTCSIASQAAMTWASRHDIDWRVLWVYLAGGLPGMAIGIWVLFHANHTVYTGGLGVFLLAYGTYMLVRKPVVLRRQHAAFDFAAGILGGITGGAAAFPSAFITIWNSMKGWNKSRQRGIFQPFILIMQIIGLASISLTHRAGAASVGFNTVDLLFIPASLLGTSLGLALYKRLSDHQFARVVNILLIVSGVSYLL